MLETYYRMLNPTETIQRAMPAITEAFVTFYGEENREFIEQKFRDILIIGYSSPATVKRILNDMKKIKSDELIKSFLEEVGVEVSSPEAKMYIDTSYLDNTYSIPIHFYSSFLNGELPAYQMSKVVEFLKNFYPEVTLDNLQELENQDHFREIKEKVRKYDSIRSHYLAFLDTIKDYEDYVSKYDSYLRDLKDKYDLEFVETFKEFIPEEELEKIRKAKNVVRNAFYYTPYLSTLKSWDLKGNALIDAFDEEQEAILHSDQEWRVKSVKKDRIEYFKKCGIDHGDNYEEYMDDPECQRKIPSLDFIKMVREKRLELYTRMGNEFYLSTEDYKKNRKRIEESGCLVDKDYFDANAFENNATFIADNLVNRNGEYSIFALLCINMGGIAENLDADIIHELNHVLELHLVGVNGNEYQTICGWDTAEGKIKSGVSSNEKVNLENRKDKRGYELFNEIVNELIAQEIATILQNSGNYIFNPPGTGKIRGRTGYESTRYLITDFFNEYKDSIIASRRHGNIEKIKNAVGNQNFEDFNSLFHVHNETLSGFEFYNMYEKKKKKRDTNRTRVFHSLVNKRDEILKSIQVYQQQVSANTMV